LIGENEMQNVPETLYHEVKLLDKGIFPVPRVAFFTPTYVCNQRCYYCFYKDWNNKGIKEPTERIPEILEQLKDLGVSSIEFEGGGDPLCTKDIDKIFQKAADLQFNLGMITNGVNFKGAIADVFLKYGTYVRFSLDSVDPEIYKKVRGTDDFNTVIDNIRDALDKRVKIGSMCQLSVKIGLAKEVGYKEIHDVYNFFEGWGIDNIQVKNVWNKQGIPYRTDINRVGLQKLEDGQVIPIVKKVVYPKYMTENCWISPAQIAIDVFGDLYMCVYYMHRKNSHRIGNVFETPLKELWGSDTHKQVINNNKISECLKHNCRFMKYMRAIRKMQQKKNWEFI